MTTIRFAALYILAALILLPTAAAGSSNQEKQSGTVQIESNQRTEKNGTHDKSGEKKPRKTQKQESKNALPVPVYKPPLRGAPAGRVAGGTRGEGMDFPYLCLIVPKHVGLTVSRQPVLYYYQSGSSAWPVEFTIIREQGISPLVEARIAEHASPGIHKVPLADHGVYLETNVTYKWFISLIPDFQHRSKDILAAGAIEYTKVPEKIQGRLNSASTYKKPFVLSEAGFWYDAIHSLSSLIESEPDNTALKEQRSALLEQVGLSRAAGYDMKK